MADPILLQWRARCEAVPADNEHHAGMVLALSFKSLGPYKRPFYWASELAPELSRTPWTEVLSTEVAGFRLALRWLREEIAAGPKKGPTS